MSSEPVNGHHPRHQLDDVIHAPIRFSIVATLSAVERAEFSFVRDTVEISDSALSKQVTVLEGAGYVTVKKGYVGKRPRTWLSLSPAGQQAYAAHIQALTEIASRSVTTPPPVLPPHPDHQQRNIP